jgi:DNA-binding CsgD family transcriptional regulator
MTALMGELEAPAPTVMVLEDIHWADEATLDVLRLLARRLEAIPMLLLSSYRDEQLHRSHPLRVVLGELPSGGAVARHELGPLSRVAVARLAEESTLDPDDLYDRTGGNPFFVTEVLAAGTERVPTTVRDAVLARAARLSRPAQTMLEAVAVVPQRAEMWLLEALAEGALSGLDECVNSGMLRSEPGGVVFRHELARIAIEESLEPERTVVLHRHAVRALAEPAIGTPDLARLAHHAEAAGDTAAVLRFAPAAAEHASSLGAHREAQQQYARALRFGQSLPPEARADLLERFADASYLTDMRVQALEALDEALAIHRRQGNLFKQGETQRRRLSLLICVGRAADAMPAGLEAVGLLEKVGAERELALTCAGLSELFMRADEADVALAWGERAIALARRVDDAEALAWALNNIGTVEFGRGNPAGREKLELSIEIADRAGIAIEAGRAYANLCATSTRLCDWALHDRYAEAGSDYCREHGLDAWLSYLDAGRAESHLARGDWTAAADAAGALLGKPLEGLIIPRHSGLLVLALVRARRGDPGCWALLDEALELSERVGELQFRATVAVARAEAAWLEGKGSTIDAETAREFTDALQLGEPSFIGELACWRWRAALLDEPPAGADDLHRRQIAGDWERTARVWHERGCPYEEALALADSSEPEALHEALRKLDDLGARPAAAIVTRRLRALGERQLRRGPRRQTRENPAGLTARELEVLPFLAEGIRNAEIAERLVVSQKTVDHHVSAILRKLDVRTRGEAGAAASRLGLVDPPEVSARGPSGLA